MKENYEDLLNSQDLTSNSKIKGIKTYEENRLYHKNGFFTGTVLLFKSTIGLGLLMNQYFFGKTGLILGPLITILMSILTIYTMYLILIVADDVEENSENNNIKIENYDHLGKITFGKIFQYMCKISCFAYNLTVIFANFLNLSHFLQKKIFGYFSYEIFENLLIYKFLIIFIVLILLVFILEPEKLKYPSYFATLVLIVALFLMWCLNTSNYFHNDIKPEFDLFTFSNVSDLIGNQLYALESVASVFTIRATMKNRTDMKRSLIYSYLFCIILFSINGISFLIVF